MRVQSLAVVWSRTEPGRVGERVLVDERGGVLGRGDGRGMLRPVRARGRTRVERPPLKSPALSREQLALRAEGGGIALKRVGRRRVRVDGEEVEEARLMVGARVEVDGELLLWAEGPWPEGIDRAVDASYAGPDMDGLVGETPAMWALRDRLDALAAGTGRVHVDADAELAPRLVAALQRRGRDPRGISWGGAAPAGATTLTGTRLADRRPDVPLVARQVLLGWSMTHGRDLARHVDDHGEPMFSLELVEHLLAHPLLEGEATLRELLWASVEGSPRDRLSVPGAASPPRSAAWELSFDDDD